MIARSPFSLFILVLLSVVAQAQQGAARGLDLNNQSPMAGHYYALVIGNDNYQNVPHLKTATTDAREVAAILRASYGFQTRLLLDATRQQIISTLNGYRRELDADANLLVYYAGHGYNDRDADKAYWLPVDAAKDDPANWISADDITTTIRVIPARHVLIISDSCYSGTLTRGLESEIGEPALRPRYLQKMMAGRSRTLMASGGNEPVADGGGGGHSVFASALLRGLAQTEKAQFTAAELFRDYIEEAVAGRANQTPEYNPLRNSGHESGDFVFVRVKTDGKSVEVTVKVPNSATVDPAAVELSFWETIKNSTNPEDFKAYLAQYPNGRFAALARIRANGDRARVPAEPAATRSVSLTFNSADLGPLKEQNALGAGIAITSGSAQIASTSSNMVMPAGLNKFVVFVGPALINTPAPNGQLCAELTFTDGDASSVTVTRPGVVNNSSTPAWQLQAFNASGAQVGETVGEGDIVNGNYLFPPIPQDFTINAAGIHKIQLCSKNHLSTFGAIPIARISRTLAAVSLTGSWLTATGEVIQLVQEGTHVTGIYHGGRGHEALTGSIAGTFDGRNFVGTYQNREGTNGSTGKLTLTLDDNRLAGRWVSDTTPGQGGAWVMTRQ